MIYKILKHSLSCLPTCQECAAARILGWWGCSALPCSLLPALPWQRRTPGCLPVLRQCRSPFIHQSARLILSVETWYSSISPPYRALISAKMLGWKSLSGHQQVGAEEWNALSSGDFIRAPVLEKGTVELSSLLHPPQPSPFPADAQFPAVVTTEVPGVDSGSSWRAQNPLEALWKHRFLGPREFWFSSSVVRPENLHFFFPPALLKYNWYITLDKFKVYNRVDLRSRYIYTHTWLLQNDYHIKFSYHIHHFIYGVCGGVCGVCVCVCVMRTFKVSPHGSCGEFNKKLSSGSLTPCCYALSPHVL